MKHTTGRTKLANGSVSYLSLVCQKIGESDINGRMEHRQTYVLPRGWDEPVEDWVVWLIAGGTPKTTLKLRRGHIRGIARRSGTSSPREITLAMLVKLCSDKQWSLEHRRGVRRSLIMFFDWSLEQRLVEHNPAAKLPKVPSYTPNPSPCPDQMWRELLMAADQRQELMIRLAGEVGMRRAEVARCHRDDLVRDLTGWSLIVHGKGGKQRLVPITDKLAEQVAKHTGYLFPGNEDGHLSAHHVGKMISRLMPPGWSMHKLRHRFATRGLAATGDLMAVRDALGHASVATTQIYTAVGSDKVRKVVEGAADSELTRVSAEDNSHQEDESSDDLHHFSSDGVGGSPA